MSTIDATLAERGSRYGEFTDHAEITQSIKFAMGMGRNWAVLPDDMKEALEMVAHKVGRILNGDPEYIDSWTDIIGYTRLVEKRLIEQSKPKPQAAAPGPQDTIFVQTKAADRKAAMPDNANTVSIAAQMAASAVEVAKRIDKLTAAKPCDCIGCTFERFLSPASKP